MAKKQLKTKQIFDVLNGIKLNIGLAVSDFVDNQVLRDKAIKNMELRLKTIKTVINQYFFEKNSL